MNSYSTPYIILIWTDFFRSLYNLLGKLFTNDLNIENAFSNFVSMRVSIESESETLILGESVLTTHTRAENGNLMVIQYIGFYFLYIIN